MFARQPAAHEQRRHGAARAQQHRGLQRQCQALDQPACAGLSGGCQRRTQPVDKGVVSRVRPRSGREFAVDRIQYAGFARQRAQHVEALDVAAAFPDRVERRLPVQPRQEGVLHVTRATQALLRLVDEGRGALADPVLAGGGGDAGECRLTRVVRGRVHRARHAQREHQRRLRLQRQVRQHVAHQGMRDQGLAERAAMVRMVQCLRQRHAHLRRRAQHAVQARQHDHLDDGRHAPALLADAPGMRTGELDLAGGVRPVAQLVLQPHQPECVPVPIVQAPGHQEAAESGRRLRQHQEAVAHRRGEEPFVPDQYVSIAARRGRGGVGAHVGPALLLGHAHAQGDAGLVGDGDVARIVVRCGGLCRPVRQTRLALQDRHRGMRHRQGATGAGFGLVMQVAQRRARDVRARSGFVPRQPRHPMRLRGLHQAMVGGMEFDRVDAPAMAVVGAQARPVAIGVEAQPIEFIAGQCTVSREPRCEGGNALARDRLAQRQVVRPQVARLERRRLVVDPMGFERR